MPRPVRNTDVSSIDFAALGVSPDSEGGDGPGANSIGNGSSRKKKSSSKRSHRRRAEKSTNLDFLQDLDPMEMGGKKPNTRGMRNHVTQAPASYEQPAWMSYKERGADGAKKSRRSNGHYEGKQGGRTSPKGRDSYEGKVGTPRDRISGDAAGHRPRSKESKTGRAAGRAAGSPDSTDVDALLQQITPRSNGSGGGETPRGQETPRIDSGRRSGSGNRRSGNSASRSRKSKTKKTKSNKNSDSFKSQTLPKQAAQAFPSINGARSVAHLLQAPGKNQQRSIDLSMRAVGVSKKQHEKPVSMKKSYASGDRGHTAIDFSRQFTTKTGPSKKTMTGFM